MRKFNYCADYIYVRNNRTYEFGIQNGADADMSINIKLGLDACARLIPIAEECLGNYIPQLFPIVFLDETVNVRCTYAYALPVLAPLDQYVYLSLLPFVGNHASFNAALSRLSVLSTTAFNH